MAKFRRNHQQTDRSGFAGMLIRVFLFIAICAVAFVYIYNSLNKSDNHPKYNENRNYNYTPSGENINLIPEGSNGQIIQHDYYVLSFIEKYEQAEWVAYKLTAESLRVPKVKRNKRFTEDYAVKTKSARHKDYSHSGYTRGHLAPAGDMAFNETAMKQSFFMSNMSPQIRAFNGGIWRELEENVRNWAMANDEVYVISGPIFYQEPTKYIGENKVAVPDAFYKIIVDNFGSEKKGIAFIIPHEKSTKPLSNYAVTVDEVESTVKIDFLKEILGTEEQKLESEINLKDWEFDKKKFKQRINNWNNN